MPGLMVWVNGLGEYLPPVAFLLHIPAVVHIHTLIDYKLYNIIKEASKTLNPSSLAYQ